MSGPPREPVVVLYDGGCRLCRAIAAAIAAWDRRGRLAILPFSDPRAAAIAAAIAPERRFRAAHAARGGDVRTGGDAFRLVLGELPVGSALRALGAARLYGPVAARRGRLGRLVPDLPPTRRDPAPR